ncbi:MAG: rhodanese-like domain-containing protein [Anaeromyxobacteraceae bacterium]|nr:rhodanese-like domain-containing protein [Anaeromyxobacteraceae bacterium]
MRSLAVALLLLQSVPALAADEFVGHEEAKALLGKPNVRFVWADSEKEFTKGHIPGSVDAFAHDLHFLDDVRACKGLPMCEPRAARFIGETLGIDAGTEVVVYDLGAGANASGTWFFLRLYGVKRVRILEGGLATWKAHGGPVEPGQPAKVAARTFAPTVDWSMIASVEEVKKATADAAHYLLLDSRHNLDEFTGKTLQTALASPDREITVKRGGAIPGAVFSPWSKYAGNKDGQADKPTLKDPGDLAKQLEKLKKSGYDPAKTVISYCHVGLGRGSFQYLALRAAGHENVKVYVGSWDEWGNDPSLPLAAQP